MPDTINLEPPAHATYDISSVICAELVAEELFETMTPRQRKRFIDVLESLEFKVTIKEDNHASA